MSHRYLMAALSIVAVLLAAGPLAGTASAQDISFTLDDERLLVTVNKDGSVDLNYTFSFGNVTYLDGVDIGLPNEHYNLLTATATIVVGGEERRLTDIRESPFIDVGVAVEFDEDTMNEIVSAGEFELKFHVNNPQMVYRNEMREGTAGVVVRPTWFSEEFQTGPTARMNVTILLPEGMSNRSEVLWLESDPFDPIYVDEATGRLAASWQFINVPPSQQASGAYDVGVGFPEHYVDVVFDPPAERGAEMRDGHRVILKENPPRISEDEESHDDRNTEYRPVRVAVGAAWAGESRSAAADDHHVRAGADGRRGRRGLRRAVRRPQRGTDEHPQRLSASGVGHPRRHDRCRDPQATREQHVPRLATGTPPPRRHPPACRIASPPSEPDKPKVTTSFRLQPAQKKSWHSLRLSGSAVKKMGI